ncbi:AMP-binding protein [Allorhizocola rhizosphaerae]|uniref:AMP-binding protein n=1 Tax=Allorhizocola rhizosphaerae TaxID=1872709 RepID=UPI0013C35CCF|nr:AMP-binding protein [Allorhizocola rhizosphaerae]
MNTLTRGRVRDDVVFITALSADQAFYEVLHALQGDPGPFTLATCDPPEEMSYEPATDIEWHADYPAYVIYTSGSTGRPKGMVSPPGALLGKHLAEVHATQRVDPALIPLAALATVPPAQLPYFDTVIGGGDACTVELVWHWMLVCHPISFYGPTESMVMTDRSRLLVRDVQAPTIGRPILSSRVDLHDAALRPVVARVAGELHLAGLGLARGYQHRPGFTAERFVDNPFGEPGQRMYRTGDVVRWHDDGQLEFAGAGGGVACSTGVGMRLRDSLDVAVLEASLAGLLLRHESLWTILQTVDARGVQVVVAQGKISPQQMDLSTVEISDEVVDLILDERLWLPFDLRTLPLTGALLIRPHFGLDARGSDAMARLEDRFEIMRVLASISGVAEALGLFDLGEHRALAMECVDGRLLSRQIANRLPLLKGGSGRHGLAQYTTWAMTIYGQIETATQTTHQERYVDGDLHLWNLLVCGGDTIGLLDYGVAIPVERMTRPGFANQGFSAPSTIARFDIDLYALACLMLASSLPMSNIVRHDRTKARHFGDITAADFLVPNYFPERAVAVAVISPDGLGGWKQAWTSLTRAIAASANLRCDAMLYPSDPRQFATDDGEIGLAFGAAGVLYALAVTGDRGLVACIRHQLGQFRTVAGGYRDAAQRLATLPRGVLHCSIGTGKSSLVAGWSAYHQLRLTKPAVRLIAGLTNNHIQTAASYALRHPIAAPNVTSTCAVHTGIAVVVDRTGSAIASSSATNEVRETARRGYLASHLADALGIDHRRLRSAAIELVWPVVFARLTRRVESGRKHCGRKRAARAQVSLPGAALQRRGGGHGPSLFICKRPTQALLWHLGDGNGIANDHETSSRRLSRPGFARQPLPRLVTCLHGIRGKRKNELPMIQTSLRLQRSSARYTPPSVLHFAVFDAANSRCPEAGRRVANGALLSSPLMA